MVSGAKDGLAMLITSVELIPTEPYYPVRNAQTRDGIF